MLREILYDASMYGDTVPGVLERFILAPVEQPELLPSLLPLIAGAIVIELYFGKYEQEKLGWNTSVGNAIIWVTTGISLLMTHSLETGERYAVYFLIGTGTLIGYMDFFHKWSSTVAFVISSSGIVYSIAYVTVIFVRTNLTVNRVSLKAAVLFLIGINLLFKLIQSFENPARDQFGLDFQ